MTTLRRWSVLALVGVLALPAGCAGDESPSTEAADAGTPDTSADTSVTLPDVGREDDLGQADQAPPAANCPQGAPFSVKIRKVSFTAMVDGKGPFALIYDTGAGQTVLSPKITGGKVNELIAINKIDLGGGVTVGPIKAYTYPMPPSSKIEGIIGNDAFAGRVITVDYGRQQLWVDDELDQAALAACAHLAAVEPTTLDFQTTKQGHLLIPGRVDGLDGALLVDTGASLGGIEQGALDQAKGEHPAIHGYFLSAFIGNFWSSYARVNEVSVGPHTVKRVVMYTLPDQALGEGADDALATLPYGFLQHFVLTIDFANSKIRFAPLDGAVLDGGFTLYGLGISLSVNDQGPVTISNVISGGPADTAGLQAGDEVLSIGGTDPATVAVDQRIRLVLAQGPGVAQAVTTRRDGQPKTRTLTSADLFPQ